MKSFLLVAFTFVGVGLVAAAIWLSCESWALAKSGRRTEAKILSFQERNFLTPSVPTELDIGTDDFRTLKERRHTFARVRYRDVNGNDQEAIIPRDEMMLDVGAKVPIIVDPSNPLKIVPDSLWPLWGLPITLGFFGVATIGMASMLPKSRDNKKSVRTADQSDH